MKFTIILICRSGFDNVMVTLYRIGRKLSFSHAVPSNSTPSHRGLAALFSSSNAAAEVYLREDSRTDHPADQICVNQMTFILLGQVQLKGWLSHCHS